MCAHMSVFSFEVWAHTQWTDPRVFTPVDVNAVLAGFFFEFMSLFPPSSFCVCEDANVTHKVSIVKKKKNEKKKTKKKDLHGWVCLQYSFDICC